MLQTSVHPDEEAISANFSQGKGESYLVPLLLNQIGLEEVMNHLMFQVKF